MEEIVSYNKIYARTNENGIVTHFFSEAFETPTEKDVCVDSTNTERHGAQKYSVVDENGFYNYEIKDGVFSERDKTGDIEAAEVNAIRERRKNECFSVINRGELWYSRLTEEQKQELEVWYQDWLDAPQTKTIPVAPTWINQKT